MDWTAEIDLYCERLGAGLWAEPLNALTNLAFILAAILMWRRTKGMAAGRVLSGILFSIGIGSGLFHTFATGWAGLADEIPIGIFILAYLYLVNRDFAGLPVWGAVLATAAFVPYAWFVVPVLDLIPFIQISNFYWTVPILLVSYGFGLLFTRPETARGLFLGAAILTLSIVLRSLDNLLCGAWPLGTHFLWHCLNALMLAVMIEVWRRDRLRRLAGAEPAR